MTTFSEYVKGELDIFFFAPKVNDVVRVFHEMVGIEEEDVRTQESNKTDIITGLCTSNNQTLVDETNGNCKSDLVDEIEGTSHASKDVSKDYPMSPSVTVSCELVEPADDRIDTANHIESTPERSFSASSTETSPSNVTKLNTPLKWTAKDFNFESAGFSPDELKIIKRKIEAQKLVFELRKDINSDWTKSDSATLKTFTKTSNVSNTANSTINVPLDLQKQNNQDFGFDQETTEKRTRKFKSDLEALSIERHMDASLLVE